MRKILEFLLYVTLKSAFWLRYSVTVKGLDKLNLSTLTKPGGLLFLPNHPAVLVDPTLVSLAIWKKVPIRPLIVEYMYFTPIVHGVMKFLNALPIPDFETSTNSLKRKRNEMALSEVIKGLKSGENFLLYPAGRVKLSAYEDVGGASATQRVIAETPEANVVLIRTKGLWGSMFSRAIDGKVPSLYNGIWEGFKTILKNLIFFTPRREVIIEMVPAPADFPYGGSRLELNKWLENWYNQPDGLTEQEGNLPGDSLIQVSYKFWTHDVPEIKKPKEIKEEVVHIKEIDDSIQDKVLAKLTELTEIQPSGIKPTMSLSSDLGLDSLDTSELATYLQDEFDTGPIPVVEMTTVSRVMGIASKQIQIEEDVVEEQQDLAKWKYSGERFRAQVAHGDTIPEVFLNNCARMGNSPALADMRSGIMSYSRLKIATILMAEEIRKFEGKYVGILLPASVGAYVCVLATQLAGKVPLMINWTIGPRHLKSVRELSDVKVVLTSWAFLEKLDTADLSGIDDIMVMVESMKREFNLVDKLRALYRSKLGTKRVLKTFGIDKQSKDDPAVLLFTSGTESMPKGVPLSHDNILSNQRSAFDAIDLYSDDVMLGILPPFHAYGFSTSGLAGILSGMRIAFYPDPTDGKGVAKSFETWQATVMSGAPSFIKQMIKAAKPEQLRTLRLCVTGAEKAPPELFKLMANIGKEQSLLEGYGITECSPILTANRIGKPRKGVGSPVPGVEVLIVNLETHEVTPQGGEGLILVRGPNVFQGYLNPGIASPFLTVEGKEWYNTGDIGHLDEENRLTISGRLKRFIKIGGEMVSLQSIESALLHDASARSWPIREEGPTLAVIAQEIAGQKPTIFLVATFEATADQVNDSLRESGFSNLVRISKVVSMDEIPIMGTGKINYRQLEEIYFSPTDTKA